MEHPILQLVVENGPKKGETLECKPGTLVLIGRVIRGNTFAIRDAGISQKHLSFDFDREMWRWVLSDLDTSNGTILNGSRIQASVPVPISDGDNIKIGEKTDISVKIAGEKPQPAVDEAVKRRGRRRGVPPLPPPLERSEEEKPLDLAVEEVRGRGRTRSKRNPPVSDKVSKKDDTLDSGVVEESIRDEKGRASGRRPTTRSVSARVSSEEEESQSSVVVPDSKVQEAGKKRRARANSARVCKEEEEGVKEARGPVLVHDLEDAEASAKGTSEMEGHAGVEQKDGGKGGGKDRSMEEVGDDMDSMTLGQWFDRMEKFLPQMIHDASEEIISILREKAHRFDEFIAAGSNAD
ncbi:uncharacterized protein [Typha latifolia]|uniref:uncharacterized protein n=1 Tax=Typha latifolia TaxID=4733 RepID=UPI003C2E217B